MLFSSIIGHKLVLEEIKKNIDTDIKGVFLFKGPVGVGKLKVARLLSKYLICIKDKDDLCNCSYCRNFPYISEYLELNNNEESILIEDISKLEEFLSIVSYNNRAVVINNVHNLNLSASNRLLKLLEDSLDRITLFLISHRVDLIAPPLVSRCKQISFSYLKQEEMQNILKNLKLYDEFSDELIKMSYFFSRSLIENYNIYKKMIEEVLNVFKLLVSGNIVEVLTIIRKIKEKEEETLFAFIDLFLILLNDIMRIKLGETTKIMFVKNREKIEEIASCFNEDLCIFSIEKLNKLKRVVDKKINVNEYQLFLSYILWISYFLTKSKEVNSGRKNIG